MNGGGGGSTSHSSREAVMNIMPKNGTFATALCLSHNRSHIFWLEINCVWHCSRFAKEWAKYMFDIGAHSFHPIRIWYDNIFLPAKIATRYERDAQCSLEQVFWRFTTPHYSDSIFIIWSSKCCANDGRACDALFKYFTLVRMKYDVTVAIAY